MILVIGSTGNIGKNVVSYLKDHSVAYKEGVYKPKVTTKDVVNFDFLDPSTFELAMENITQVFFIRPPKLGNPKDIYPFLDYCNIQQLKQVVFVSLMGVEKNPIPPHAKIEKYIKKIGLPYTFIRPSFFMENLIYPHGSDIKKYNQLIVPAKKSKTSFIAAKDIGNVCGEVLLHPTDHLSNAYTLTGPNALDYFEVADMFTSILRKQVTYTNPTMKSYGKHMIKEGYDKDYIKITKLLYFMTRIGTAKLITNNVEKLLNRPATTLEQFIKEHKNVWL